MFTLVNRGRDNSWLSVSLCAF